MQAQCLKGWIELSIGRDVKSAKSLFDDAITYVHTYLIRTMCITANSCCVCIIDVPRLVSILTPGLGCADTTKPDKIAMA